MGIPEKYSETKLRVGSAHGPKIISERTCYTDDWKRTKVCSFWTVKDCVKAVEQHNKEVKVMGLLLGKSKIVEPPINATDIALGSLLAGGYGGAAAGAIGGYGQQQSALSNAQQQQAQCCCDMQSAMFNTQNLRSK